MVNSVAKIFLVKEDVIQKKWQRFNMKHGIYKLKVPLEELSSVYGTETTVRQIKGVPSFTLTYKIEQWLKAVELKNIEVKNGEASIYGRFVKHGSKLYFSPEHEKSYETDFT